MSEQENHTPANGYTPVSPVIFPPVPIPQWPDGWWIAAVDARNPDGPHVLLSCGPGDGWRWIPLRNCEAVAPIEPWFLEVLRSGKKPPNASDEIRINLVLFEPSVLYRLHDGQHTVEFLARAPRKRVSCSWGELPRIFGRSVEGTPVRYFANEDSVPVRYDTPGARLIEGTHPNMVKRARGAWVPGAFTGTCGHRFMADDGDKFIATNLLVCDADEGDPHAIAKELEQYAVIINSTFKHRPERPRCRVIFLLASPCKSKRDYDKAERFIAEQLNSCGFFVPPGDSTLGRLAYLPMHQPGVTPVFIKNDGRPLDLAPILAMPSPPEREEDERTRTAPEAGSAGSALAWARRHIIGCPLGRRHTTLYATAAWLAEKTSATDDEIMNTLLPAALAVAVEGNGAGAKKQKCIRDGMARGRGKS